VKKIRPNLNFLLLGHIFFNLFEMIISEMIYRNVLSLNISLFHTMLPTQSMRLTYKLDFCVFVWYCWEVLHVILNSNKIYNSNLFACNFFIPKFGHQIINNFLKNMKIIVRKNYLQNSNWSSQSEIF